MAEPNTYSKPPMSAFCRSYPVEVEFNGPRIPVARIPIFHSPSPTSGAALRMQWLLAMAATTTPGRRTRGVPIAAASL